MSPALVAAREALGSIIAMAAAGVPVERTAAIIDTARAARKQIDEEISATNSGPCDRSFGDAANEASTSPRRPGSPEEAGTILVEVEDASGDGSGPWRVLVNGFGLAKWPSEPATENPRAYAEEVARVLRLATRSRTTPAKVSTTLQECPPDRESVVHRSAAQYEPGCWLGGEPRDRVCELGVKGCARPHPPKPFKHTVASLRAALVEVVDIDARTPKDGSLRSQALAYLANRAEGVLRPSPEKTSAWTDEERSEMRAQRERDNESAYARGPDGRPLRVTIDSRETERRLVVTDLCDMIAFQNSEGRLGQILRRAVNFIEGEEVFPGASPWGVPPRINSLSSTVHREREELLATLFVNGSVDKGLALADATMPIADLLTSWRSELLRALIGDLTRSLPGGH